MSIRWIILLLLSSFWSYEWTRLKLLRIHVIFSSLGIQIQVLWLFQIIKRALNLFWVYAGKFITCWQHISNGWKKMQRNDSCICWASSTILFATLDCLSQLWDLQSGWFHVVMLTVWTRQVGLHHSCWMLVILMWLKEFINSLYLHPCDWWAFLMF